MAELFDSIRTGRELTSYLNSKGCDCSQGLTNLTRDFQVSFNKDVNEGNITDAVLVNTDGKYGQSTKDALLRVVDVAPNTCYGNGRPCSSNVPVVVPPVQPPVVVLPTQPPSNPAIQPAGIQTATAKTNWAPWIIGGLAVAAGAGLVYMMSQQEKNKKKPSRSLRENPVRRRRRRRNRRTRR